MSSLFFSLVAFSVWFHLVAFPLFFVWLHLHWRLQGFATRHLSPQIASPRLCPRIILCMLYISCIRITCIRIHRVYVLRVYTYCLGGVLLEGLRIRLTSHYSVEAAADLWLHLIIHNGLLTFPTTRCQDKNRAGSDPLIERIKQHDTI